METASLLVPDHTSLGLGAKWFRWYQTLWIGKSPSSCYGTYFCLPSAGLKSAAWTICKPPRQNCFATVMCVSLRKLRKAYISLGVYSREIKSGINALLWVFCAQTFGFVTILYLLHLSELAPELVRVGSVRNCSAKCYRNKLLRHNAV